MSDDTQQLTKEELKEAKEVLTNTLAELEELQQEEYKVINQINELMNSEE